MVTKYADKAVKQKTDNMYDVMHLTNVLKRVVATFLNDSAVFSHFLLMPMRFTPCMLVIQRVYQARLDYSNLAEMGLSDTYLTFLWPSDDDTGPVVTIGFLFLGRPGPLRAGLRGVSSFLFANTCMQRRTLRNFIWHSISTEV